MHITTLDVFFFVIRNDFSIRFFDVLSPVEVFVEVQTELQENQKLKVADSSDNQKLLEFSVTVPEVFLTRIVSNR